jgi:hypothetical protein
VQITSNKLRINAGTWTEKPRSMIEVFPGEACKQNKSDHIFMKESTVLNKSVDYPIGQC